MDASPLVIALGHRKRVGKDTVASILVDQYAFLTVSFARPLKGILNDMFPHLTHDQLHGESKETPDVKLGGHTPREFMIRLATSIRSRMGPRAFIEPVISNLVPKPESTHPERPRVVTDMRFLNEYRALQQSVKNCVFVRVVRPGVRMVTSENELDKDSLWDYTIVNDGNLKQLSAAVRKLLVRMALRATQTATTSSTNEERVFKASSFKMRDE